MSELSVEFSGCGGTCGCTFKEEEVVVLIVVVVVGRAGGCASEWGGAGAAWG